MTCAIDYSLNTVSSDLILCPTHLGSLASDRSGNVIVNLHVELRRQLIDGSIHIVRVPKFIRHFIHSQETQFFGSDERWPIESGDSLVDMYLINQQYPVIIRFNPDSRQLTQTLFQLVKPNRLPKVFFQSFLYKTSYMLPRSRGLAFAVCERKKTINRLLPPFSISQGQLHSKGRILIAGKRGVETAMRTPGGRVVDAVEGHLIAANPLCCEEIPDVDLHREMDEMCIAAANRDLQVLPRHITTNANGDIVLLLYWLGDDLRHLRTSDVGKIEILPSGGQFKATFLESLDDSKLPLKNLLPSELLMGSCNQGGRSIYYTFLLPNTKEYSKYGFRLRIIAHSIYNWFISKMVQLVILTGYFDHGFCMKLLLQILQFIHGDNLLPEIKYPAHFLTIALDINSKVYHEVRPASFEYMLSTRRLAQALPTVEASEEKLVATWFPCICAELDASNLAFRMRTINDPSSPATLKRASQCALSKTRPNLNFYFRDTRTLFGV